MQGEEASLWIVPANEGSELAFLIKAPTSAIKALVAGCPMELVIGREGNYLCTGVRIHDMPDAPVMVSGVSREREEHESLARLLVEREVPVFLFNELDACLAWTNVRISTAEAEKIATTVGDFSSLYIGPFSKECSTALDCFCYSSDPSHTYPNARRIDLANSTLELEGWRTNQISYVGLREYQAITIDDKDEGEMFERAAWASLESVFPFSLYKSPKVCIGNKARELTDIMASHEYGAFLIEAKDLSVLQAGYGRDQDRRTSGVQKQAKKAIGQLVGASKALMRGDRIIDDNGREVFVNRTHKPHCIVLITELMHVGDWSSVEMQMIEAMHSTGAYFHLLDLREFITLLKLSNGQAALFDYNLMERAEKFVERPNVHVRSRPAKPSSTD